MASLDVKIDGLDDFLRDVRRAGIDAKPLVRGALQNSATRTQSNIRSRAAHKTGALQRSVLTTVNYPSAKVSVEEKYGVFVEEGTRPHVIEPNGKQALYWKGAFHPVKRVYHPGSKAKPFFKPGVDASVDYINEQFLKVCERLIKVMAG